MNCKEWQDSDPTESGWRPVSRGGRGAEPSSVHLSRMCTGGPGAGESISSSVRIAASGTAGFTGGSGA